MARMKLVVVGNGMAGMRTLEELIKIAPDLYDITVFGAEGHPNYNRILLSHVLTGETRFEDIMLNALDWYEGHGITLHLNKRVVRIDRGSRTVFADDGTSACYDRLLLSTGSTPVILPMPGSNLKGVMGFRNIRDVEIMIEKCAMSRYAVVIGGGLLGLEAANGLMARGMDVTVAHIMPWLLERQMDETSGRMLQKSLESKGIKFLIEREAAEVVGDSGNVKALKFKDGSIIPADIVIMAAGTRPDTALAESAGIYCNRGIVVNDTMQTYDPRIYALGECVNHRGINYGLVAPLFEMAKVCANHLALMGYALYKGSQVSTRLKVTGIDIFSAGDIDGGNFQERIIFHDPAAGIYKKLVIKENKIAGLILYGDTADGSWYFQLMREGRDISDIRKRLISGQAHTGTGGHEGKINISAMPDSMEVCGCNGVRKGTIVKAIKEKGLFTVGDVRKHTKASGSCGSCTGLVEQILIATLGGDYSPAPDKMPMCECTEYTHEEVRRAIHTHSLLSIHEVFEFMEWKNPDGCSACRPAINYYLISTWPGEAEDDPMSRFVNERVHANIQKDGTYSVVPRIWGGVTTPEELRRIADAAERHMVPMVKITGGQRIALLGVKKEDLPGIWADLDMPSGYAYGKALRTVKTCVGNRFCRFGTQDSVEMGVALERRFWKMWAPHKVKIAVSGCPRNCAEAAIKDVGIIGVDSGWEIYIGGNGGVKTEVAKFLAKVTAPEEVLEYVGAFLELYREEARYLDRTAAWIERVGLDYIKAKVVTDEENRKALNRRLLFALQREKEPWFERSREGVERREFEIISL